MASNNAVATALAILTEAFPTREVTKQTASVWATVLADVPDDQLSRAVLRLCRDPERRFFPTTGEVFAALRLEAAKRVLPRLVPSAAGLYESRTLRLADPNTPKPMAALVEAATENITPEKSVA